MSIIIGLIILIGFGVFLKEKTEYECTGEIVVIASSVCICVAIVFIPFTRMDSMSYIEKYNSVAKSIEETRNNKDISEIERANLSQKIIEINSDLASYRYYNNTVFDIFIVDEVTELDDLR